MMTLGTVVLCQLRHEGMPPLAVVCLLCHTGLVTRCTPLLYCLVQFLPSMENPSVQTCLVLCCKCLCISRPQGAIQMCYYYYITWNRVTLIQFANAFQLHSPGGGGFRRRPSIPVRG